ncbi:MAG TPA: hypothetical protein DEP42_00320 [Ruminococcaceae bacterium]|nr:hypothetical protein [Oscillospiraceae bacterium]
MDIFKIDERIEQMSEKALQTCAPAFTRIEKMAAYNSRKVLAAFAEHRVSESHFAPSTGYGYGDRGRDTLDAVFADALGAEDALVRHHFVSGTHTISTALFGVLRPGDVMLSCSGLPYDTLHGVIGLKGKGQGSLKEYGVTYEQIDLLPDGEIDLQAVAARLQKGPVKMAYLQRSRGYSLRPSLTIDRIAAFCKIVKKVSPHTLVVVDNCYGEFVEGKEPPQVGADLIMGSLIKNPGAGMADSGGYIAGKHELVELAAYRLTAPGVGRDVGASLGHTRSMFKGLFFSPHVTGEALKTAVFAAALFEHLGYQAMPHWNAPRTDIIETVELGDEKALIAFCQGLQKGSPIDSFVTPEPWDMPGYDSKVIMAAGAFTLGASIELSADAPLRPPYAVWMQGGLTFETAKVGVQCAAQALLEEGFLSL